MNKLNISHLQNDQLQYLFGVENKNLHYLEETFDVQIFARGNELSIQGDETDITQCIKTLQDCMQFILTENKLTLNDVKQIKEFGYFDKSTLKPITYSYNGKQIFPKTHNQNQLVTAFENHDMIFALGPAGTGKTFLAVAYGIKLFRQNEIKRIILVRPAVEAGESLGFLPGDLKEKVDPYLQPLYDSLNMLLGNETVDKLIEKKVIEIAPLAYMRGRTLDDALVILDEAQNTTKSQMKMFLTRMGYNSKMIINGDLTQIDLKNRSDSGLLQATQLLKDIKEIKIIELGLQDIVRHPLVSKILKKYEQ